MKKNSFHLISLGCAKNTVDSNTIADLLAQAGYSSVDSPRQAEFVIVNTCGFIKSARQESTEILQELGRKKRRGQYLIAAGCLPQRMLQPLSKEISHLDGIISTRRWSEIDQLLKEIKTESSSSSHSYLSAMEDKIAENTKLHRYAIQGKSAYLKIADGCRHACAFCSIPMIKGQQQSRPLELVLRDVLSLQELGVKEINLIAQDTTDYGHDLGMRDGLAILLEKIMSEKKEMPWIRVLYAYPGNISDHLIEVMAEYENILPYLDIPLQHSHPQILRQMHRPASMDHVFATIEKMRRTMPNIAIRSTFIVGFPGEGEREFDQLLDFVRQVKFDRIGVFTYSFEKGTPAEPLGDPISEEVKQDRRERLMLLQEEISMDINRSFIGKTLPVLIEGTNNGISVGRSYRDAPEIDGYVIVKKEVEAGTMISARITEATTHDLIAEAEQGDSNRG
jgi:ribosomal protein S12 methylthiotransferase